jgi:heterodisulfide reductase subunit C2
MEKSYTPIESIDSTFLTEVEQLSGIKVSACFQCRKCTNGCPVTFAMDIYPDQVMRHIHLGLKRELRECATIWVCSSCETCTTRCPNEIDIAGVMDFLKQTLVREKIEAREKTILAFHKVFLNEIRKRGRIFEAGMMQTYLMKSGQLVQKIKDRSIFDEMLLGWTMARKGRLNFLPKKIKGSTEIEKLFKDRP